MVWILHKTRMCIAFAIMIMMMMIMIMNSMDDGWKENGVKIGNLLSKNSWEWAE